MENDVITDVMAHEIDADKVVNFIFPCIPCSRNCNGLEMTELVKSLHQLSIDVLGDDER